MTIKARAYILCLILLLFGGCTHVETWEKVGGSQYIFDLDSRECAYIANQIALQQSETGRKADPLIFSQAYSECLGAKGWQRKTAAVEPQQLGSVPPAPRQLAEALSNTSVKGFGQTITVPDSYTMLTNKRFQSGPTFLEQFFWQGKDGTFINILFQENLAANFAKLPYTVEEPYVLYTSSKREQGGERLQWATFFGQADQDWVMITGAYYYASKKERIIIVITSPLAQPSGEVAERAVLARNQYLQIEKFSKQWQNWLDQQFPEKEGIMTKMKRFFKLGL